MEMEILAASAAFTAGQLKENLHQMSSAHQLLSKTARTAEERGYLAVLKKNICRAYHTVNRITIIQRLTDDNEIRLFPKDLDLGVWAEELGQELESALALSGRTFTLDAPDHLLACVDPHMVQLMLLELIAHEALTSKSIAFTLSLQNDNLCFKLSCDGSIGDLSRLFDPDVSEEDYGPALAMHIAELHDGTVMANSGREGGSSITVLIPRRDGRSGRRLESPYAQWDNGGFGPVMLALSDVLPNEYFSEED